MTAIPGVFILPPPTPRAPLASAFCKSGFIFCPLLFLSALGKLPYRKALKDNEGDPQIYVMLTHLMLFEIAFVGY